MTTPLHLLQPEYKVPYGNLTVEQVKKDIDRVFATLSSIPLYAYWIPTEKK